MKVRVPAILPRFLVLVAVWLLGTSTLLLAQGDDTATEPPAAATEQAAGGEEQDRGPAILLVPDVRGLPYVFAKGVLEDSGFAWRVEGKVEGYAVNLVAEQSVPPGTEVANTGAPTLILNLKRSSAYDEVGLPDDRSPYPGTKVVMADEATADPATEEASPEAPATDPATDPEPAADEEAPAPGDGSEPSQAEASTPPTTDVENAAETQGSSTTETETEDAASGSAARTPAFVLPGAPKEPLDEMPLPRRAEKLDAWLDAQSKLTAAGWDHYTYQHAWIVTGASFGWWHGAEALRILIGVDESLQKRFDTGAALERAARKVLAQVEKLESQAG